jgi:predicted anti-sigma-YlaC factor YlaD
MRCDEFESRLNEVLDERLPLSSDREVEEHIRHCGQCRDVARSYEAMAAGLHYNAVPPVPEGLTARIVDEVRQVERETRPPEWRVRVLRYPQRLPAAALLAAVLLLAITLTWINHWHDADAPTGEAKTGQVARAEQPRNQKPLPQRTGNAVDGQVGGPTAQHKTGAPTAENLLNLQSLPAAGWAQPGAEWAQEMADGLQPVTRPTVGAISGFLNLWGIGEEGHRS